MRVNMSCVFCELSSNRFIDETEFLLVFRDSFPVTPLHTLIIPKRHVSDYFDLLVEERSEIQVLLSKHRLLIKQEDESVTGFNIGVNIGQSAGQTVFHVHTHLIPRRDGDVASPRGGVRGVIPAKQAY
jgi:ATP adenylyltransferase